VDKSSGQLARAIETTATDRKNGHRTEPPRFIYPNLAATVEKELKGYERCC